MHGIFSTALSVVLVKAGISLPLLYQCGKNGVLSIIIENFSKSSFWLRRLSGIVACGLSGSCLCLPAFISNPRARWSHICFVFGELSAEGVDFWDRGLLCGHGAEELSNVYTDLEEGSIRGLACTL